MMNCLRHLPQAILFKSLIVNGLVLSVVGSFLYEMLTKGTSSLTVVRLSVILFNFFKK